jgi:hypothetical protein
MSYADMERMFSYGQPAAHLWSVGLEEHCGDADLPKRIELREKGGEHIGRDEFHEALLRRVPSGITAWDVTHRIYELLFGRKTKVGGLDPTESDILLTEILPLPRPQHDTWPAVYQKWWPGGPAAYTADVLPRMSQRLMEKVRIHSPSVVLLHGKTEHRKWISALGPPSNWTKTRIGERTNETAQLMRREGTVWVLTNNFVNNGRVTWDDRQIARLVEAIRSAMLREAVERPSL